MKFVVKINFETMAPTVLFESTDLQEAFKFFNEVTDENEVELAKYDEDNQILDWTNAELDNIHWKQGTWVVK